MQEGKSAAYAAHRRRSLRRRREGAVPLQLVEAEKRALELIEVRRLVPFRYVLLARERKQVLVLGPAGERLPLADGGQIRIVRPLVRRAEHCRRISRPQSGVSNRDAVTSCAETGLDRDRLPFR